MQMIAVVLFVHFMLGAYGLSTATLFFLGRLYNSLVGFRAMQDNSHPRGILAGAKSQV